MRYTLPNEQFHQEGLYTVQFPNASQVLVKSKLLRVLLEKMPWDRWLIIIKLRFKINACCILLMEKILHQLICSSPHYLQGFVHPRWFSRRISESTVCHQVTSRFFSLGWWGELNQLKRLGAFSRREAYMHFHGTVHVHSWRRHCVLDEIRPCIKSGFAHTLRYSFQARTD